MNNSTWQKAKVIFYEARGLTIDKRAAFLNDKCAETEDLRSEVEKLLASYDSGFLEETAFSASEILTESELQPGQVIGRYRINELIGSGGMGQVFLADDTELNRPVAFKVLHRDVAEDQERVRRFIQEARAASALNHPNILTIHEIGGFEGCRFIVSEYIDGETLRERMKKGMSIAESVDITCQVTAALQAAHSAGIVHRDIKPENVMIRRDGLVKVLDFGLAKLTEADDHPIDPTVAITSPVLTNPGLVMGTAAYMSPEQASGQSVDSRTDLWSVGVVLHEMITGKSPFEGESVTEIITSLLKAETTLPSSENVPPALQPICRKALAKKKESRYQSAHDLLKDLQGEKKRMEYAIEPTPYISLPGADELKTQLIRRRSTLSAEYVVGGIKRHKRAATISAAVLVFVATSFAVYRFNGAPGPSAKPSSSVPALIGPSTTDKDLRMSRFVTSGRVFDVAISPDGKFVAYTTGEPSRTNIRLQQLASSTDVELVPFPTSGRYMHLSFSPDGNFLYYLHNTANNEEILRIPVVGGTPTKIADQTDGGGTLSPDGKTIAFNREVNKNIDGEDLVVANADGSNQRVLVHTPPVTDWIYCGGAPAWSPDGKEIACWIHQTEGKEKFFRVFAFSSADGSRRQLSEKKWKAVNSAVYILDGNLVIAAQEMGTDQTSQIWVLSTDGQVKRITNDLVNYSRISATKKGDVLVTLQSSERRDLWIFPNNDVGKGRQVTTSGEVVGGFSWMPDGRIVVSSGITGDPELWIMNADGANRKRLTRDQGTNVQPIVSPDGRYIVFRSNRINNFGQIFRMNTDGSAVKQLTSGTFRTGTPSFSPDGKWLYYIESDPAKTPVIRKLSIDGGEPLLFADTDTSPLNALSVSSSGNIAYLSHGSKNGPELRQVVVLSPKGSVIRKIDLPKSAGLGFIRWMVDAQTIAFNDHRRNLGDIWTIRSGGRRPAKQFVNLAPYRTNNFDWTRDGKQLLVSRSTTTSEVVLIRSVK